MIYYACSILKLVTHWALAHAFQNHFLTFQVEIMDPVFDFTCLFASVILKFHNSMFSFNCVLWFVLKVGSVVLVVWVV